MQITIRKATVEDTKALMELNREFNGAGAVTEEYIADSLLNNPREIVLIAIADGRAAGFVCGQVYRSMYYQALHGEIRVLFVSGKYRRSGVGRELMRHMEESFRKDHAEIVDVVTSAQNAAAQAFYEHCGYTGKQKMLYRKNLS